MGRQNEVKDRVYLAASFYFPRPGPQNTERTLAIAARRRQELGIKQAVVASTSGRTGVLAMEYLKDMRVVVVTHSSGYLRPDYQEFDPENRRKIEALGGHILTCQHAFGGVGRAVRKKLGTYQVDEIMAFTLRVFGEGVKVAVEIALMAADAGLIQTTEPCLSIGGTGKGADSALILKPSNSQTFFDLKVMEVLAKPRLD